MSGCFSLSMSNACALPRPVSARALRTCLSSRSRTSGCSRPPGRTSGKPLSPPVTLQISLVLGPCVAPGKRVWEFQLTDGSGESRSGWPTVKAIHLLACGRALGFCVPDLPIQTPNWADVLSGFGRRQNAGSCDELHREPSASPTAGVFGRHRPGMACFSH